ncbi:nucleic acid-binding protein [Streptomyces justiciae]|uniref:nucleic acid-binding protein n=1 Tax=Streptomyces justiciae TaxID=2780140 RepID=UPI0021199EA9|nr:nucleic acid-binding protein [Streptomyces justiciae]MCW8383948.1 nucleic acid-binding protein [Streptomyces justiciae]
MASTYDFPSDLLEAQQGLDRVRADLRALFQQLPYSVEPMEAWERPEGYWRSSSQAYPESAGWSQEQQQAVAELQEEERRLSAEIVTHAFWDEIAVPERPDARSLLKHAADVSEDRGEQGA